METVPVATIVVSLRVSVCGGRPALAYLCESSGRRGPPAAVHVWPALMLRNIWPQHNRLGSSVSLQERYVCFCDGRLSSIDTEPPRFGLNGKQASHQSTAFLHILQKTLRHSILLVRLWAKGAALYVQEAGMATVAMATATATITTMVRSGV